MLKKNLLFKIVALLTVVLLSQLAMSFPGSSYITWSVADGQQQPLAKGQDNVVVTGGLAVMPENDDVHLAARAIKLINTSGHTMVVGTPVIGGIDATRVRFCAADSNCAYKTDCGSLAGDGGICHLWFEALKNDSAGFGTDSGIITLNIDSVNVPITMNVKYTQELYAGGEFKQADRINYMAKWNGSAWSVFGEKTNDAVESFAMLKDDLYVGGWFSKVGDISASHIAKWNGDNWSALGDGVDNLVLSLQVMDDNLYAGGWFTEAGKITANHVAKWDGTNWSALGNGLDDWVGSLAVMDDNLYVGGLFTKARNVDANYIAKWDGNNWSALDNGLSGLVHSLIVIDSSLYAGGLFRKTRDNPNCVARWDGRNWLTLGEGVNDGVLSLTMMDSNLYAGGWFTKAESIDANHIAKWDGDKWSALGKGLNGIPLSLIVMSGNLYVGGKFTKAGSIAAHNVAKWDGSNWSALGDGLNGQIDKLYSVPSLIITTTIVK